jgi:hypothetical protein
VVGRTQLANREPRFLFDNASKSAIAAASLIERSYDSGTCICQPAARLPIIESCLHWPRICKQQLTASCLPARNLSQATSQATAPGLDVPGKPARELLQLIASSPSAVFVSQASLLVVRHPRGRCRLTTSPAISRMFCGHGEQFASSQRVGANRRVGRCRASLCQGV